MRTTVILLLLFIIGLPAWAQECSKDELARKQGSFKPGTPGSIRNIAPADLARERAILNNIHKLITDRYQPVGAQISFAYVLGKHLPAAENWIADPFDLAYYILPFLCEPYPKPGKTFYVAISTPTTVRISANVLHSLSTLYAAALPHDDLRGYLLLNRKPEKKNGHWFMGDFVVGDRGTTHEVHEYRWLITYNDTLPFNFLSRKEFLLASKKRIDRELAKYPDQRANYATYLANIENALAGPAGELSRPAYINYHDEERFTAFMDESEGRGYYPVVPNPAYFRKKLPRSAPQFFSVVYKVSLGDPVFESNIANLQKAIDFTRLQSLLGK